MTGKHRTILITGGAGFIGGALVRHCLEHGYRVVNLDKLTYAVHRPSLAELKTWPGHVLVEGDVADATLVRDCFERYEVEAVVHLAAESHVDRSINDPPAFAITNVVGTCTLLDAATEYWQRLPPERRDGFRLLLVSTDEVFGSAAPNEVFDEASPLAPNSPYSASKAAGELFARAFERTYGLPILVAYPSNNYGPRQHPEKLIPRIIFAARQGQPLPVYGDGLQQRDWIHVDDCARALLSILERGDVGRRYAVSAEHCVTNLEVVREICRLVDGALADGGDRSRLITHVIDRPGHDRRYALKCGRLRDELAWQPKIKFSMGLSDAVEWYLAQEPW